MTPKMLLRWMNVDFPRNVQILTVYAIERNRFGAFVYRIVERVVDLGTNSSRWEELNDTARYAAGSYCAHNRPAQVYDLRVAAGFDRDTPDEVVRDWWEENFPMTDAQWRRSERRKAKGG